MEGGTKHSNRRHSSIIIIKTIYNIKSKTVVKHIDIPKWDIIISVYVEQIQEAICPRWKRKF